MSKNKKNLDTANSQGRLIIIEGIDGAGKTTVLQGVEGTLGLVARLQSEGIEILQVREPGGTRIGEQIRNMLKNHELQEMSLRCEALLFAAARAQITEEVIQPALKKGLWVVCDRFVLSSLAYQGYARGLDVEEIKTLSLFALNGLWPDLTIFLDLPKEVSAARRKGDSLRQEKDRIESASHDFMDLVNAGYYQALAHDNSVEIVDAEGSPKEVIKRCLETIHRRHWR